MLVDSVEVIWSLVALLQPDILSRPVESHSGARETIIGGPVTTSEGVYRRDETCEGCPLTIRLD